MMRSVLAAVVMAATSWSAPAEACGAVASGLFEIAMPFENQQVARNAVLRTPSLLGVTDGLGPTTLHGPNDTSMEATWVDDGSGARLDLHESDGLWPGAWRVEVRLGDEVIREVPFDVVDEVDTLAPVASVIVGGTRANLLQPDTNCGRVGDRLAIVANTSDGSQPVVIVVTGDGIDGELRLTTIDDGLSESFADPGSALSITLIDMAGNTSDVIEIGRDDIAWKDGELGSCASAPLSTSSLFATVLLFVRRRRRFERANAREESAQPDGTTREAGFKNREQL